MTSPLCRGCNQPKGRRRDVAWNGKVARLWNLVAKYSNAAIPVTSRSDQEIIKHHLHMIPSRCWLDHGGLALGKEPGQQQCAFHLCASNRRSITNATQRTTLDSQRWCLFRTFRHNICAHLTKRHSDAVHRTF